jgi:hypothetical protein
MIKLIIWKPFIVCGVEDFLRKFKTIHLFNNRLNNKNTCFRINEEGKNLLISANKLGKERYKRIVK